jgi:integrase
LFFLARKQWLASATVRSNRVGTLTDCDNPQMWPLVELAITTCLRKGSLLAMKWSASEPVDQGSARLGQGFQRHVALSPRAVELLKSLPHDGSDMVFSMA